MTKEDFGTYHLRAVNPVGRSASTLELVELPSERIEYTRVTPETTRRIYHFGMDNRRNEANSNNTELILSKIYSSKNLKDSLNVKFDSSDELESTRNPYNGGKINNYTRYWLKNRSRSKNRIIFSYDRFVDF